MTTEIKNISGNYETHDEEIAVVKAYLDKLGVEYERVEKYCDADAGDIMVYFFGGFRCLFEVKQEKKERFEQYGEYGIDFISSCIFREKDKSKEWKGIHKPNEMDAFLKAINPAHHFKWGKIYYSYSDIWLFYVQDENGNYTHLEGYDGKAMERDNFFKYLMENCPFAVNNKPATQLSHNDRTDGATFFISPDKMEKYKATKENFYHNNDVVDMMKEYMTSVDIYEDSDFKFYHKVDEKCQYRPHNKRYKRVSLKYALDNGYKPCKCHQ